jgi:hypothetical protein
MKTKICKNDMFGRVYFFSVFFNRSCKLPGNLEEMLVATPHVALGHFGG